MSGGGARSAYQAGVVAGLAQIAREEKLEERLKFSVFSGISGGAINTTFLASRADNWSEAVHVLWQRWSELRIESVAKADSMSMLGHGLRLVSQLGFRGWLASRTPELLNAAPLRQLLTDGADFTRLERNLASGAVHALAITATHYREGTSVTFFEGASDIQPWLRKNRLGTRATIGVEHVMASAAIPFLFAPVLLGDSYFGDGAMRMSAPLSPAIHLGADRILAIGVKHYKPDHEVSDPLAAGANGGIRLADVAGATLNALFLDAVESDVERLTRINRTLDLLQEQGKVHPENLRKIPVLTIRPSADIGQMAHGTLKNFSWVMRHFLKGLGSSSTKKRGSDLLSYIAFDSAYTSKLLDLGYQDALDQKAAVLAWLAE